MPRLPAVAALPVTAPMGEDGRVETDRPKDVLTTGDVARLCRVTIRTVIKWYDEGRLEGYRLPGSRDRRFTLRSVERFLRENDMPLDLLEAEGRQRRRVLIVEDDDAVRQMIERYLDSLGVLEVDSARSGWEAGLKTASQRPHLLLLDFRLGDTTGDKVVATIRGMTDLEQPAIVIMSAHLGEEDARRVIDQGADAFLPKPFELEQLRDTVFRLAGVRA